ncbi:MAG TPA: sigma-70 family RNA polymerase sigma factor [Pedobacter sp.]|uniref:sigma-70 family RNA polymerase sigma factor n=1 Tax=Pedobacter sp. TaxID=1411316 RepID=UPI002CA1D0E0|nr:sigma-70 family RNA polymerase sigma factor [Pedobacter sp.]HMI03488.1 sigma-70 family RNA polymerase sigma factor [Pedobacter sp.]
MITHNAIQQFKEGSPEAFRIIYDQYKKQVMNYCVTMVISRESAEELVNDIFLHLYQKREYLDPERDIKPYLFTLARNKTFNWLKTAVQKKKTRQKLELEYRAEYLQHQDRKVEAGLDLERLKDEVNKMPLQRRLIFKMCKFQEMTYSEVAEALSLKRKTVENQMGLANKQFSELVNSADYVFLILLVGFLR